MGSKENDLMLNLQSLNCFMMVTSFCSTGGFGLVISNAAIKVRKEFHGKLVSSISPAEIIGKKKIL